MTAKLIDGNALAKRIRGEVAERAAALTARGHKPGLAVILVGEDPASQVYVKHKVNDCETSGIRSVLEKYPAEFSEAALLARIAALNADPAIHGILVQMPLPKHIDPHRVIEAISVAKDVDGFSTLSAGELMTGLPGFRPCTPFGCMKLIETTGVDLRGRNAVVIGRSNTVGKPMAQLLLQANATVSICHSGTSDIGAFTRQADVVVAAVGKRNVLTASMVKPGAIVIDVGMNRDDDGKLCGDVEFAGVSQVAGWITPVPGGVGPMTRAMLLVNTDPVGRAGSGRELKRKTPMQMIRSTTENPILNTEGLPAFDSIRPEHVTPAVDELVAAADAALVKATSDAVPAEYDALSAVLDVATERLARAWGAVGHLNAVNDSPALRAAYTENMPKVVDFYTRLGADDSLFSKYKAVLADPRSAQLSAPRMRALTNALRDFKLSGAELQGAARKRYAELQDLQADVGQKFSEHVLDATDSFAHYSSADELAGVPADVVQAARNAAEAEGRTDHKLTLQEPVFFPVIQYAENRALRELMYRAYCTRASEFGPEALDNGPLITQLLAFRQEEAELLGYANAAEQSLVPKMAQSPAEVIKFLEDLGHRGRAGAVRDLAELREFANTKLGLTDLNSWDISFASQKLKEQRYSFSEQEVKQYFTEPKVLEGLFHIIETVFEVRIRPDVAPVWNPGVRFFRIERVDASSADAAPTLVGQFYLDLFARNGKRSGAWMDDVRDRWLRPDGRLQTPVAHLVCNFAPPVVKDGVTRPALLTHDDVTTLFHEFGHGLQLMLTQIQDIGVSGISGVEWDAVELPSQFMENFCWEWDVVKRLTSHVDTGEPLPRALFDRMLAAKNFHSGLDTLRQVELSLVDMRLHTEPDAGHRVAQIQQAVRDEVALITPPAFSRNLNTFTHIFDGGYAAGYYSYKWAEVLSADAWSAFEETATGASGVLNVDTGRRYREAVLESGGSRSTMDSFKAFRGRGPSIDALLRHQGLS